MLVGAFFRCWNRCVSGVRRTRKCIYSISSTHIRPHSASSSSPPRRTGLEELFATIAQLQALRPSFVSVTYGAGGSTRERTHDLIVRIQRETNLTAVSHLTCVCHTEEELAAILDRYARRGSRTSWPWAAIRPGTGEPRSCPRCIPVRGAARSLHPVADDCSRPPRVSGSASPASPKDTRHSEPAEGDGHLKRKVDAGADYICTQLFFSNPDFYDFRERCELAGIKVPIIAGIMPITSRENMVRMAELALGARIPAKLLRAIDRCGDDPQAVAKVGVHWATEQCRDLLDNQVRGIHFYTLNRSDATRQIYENLGVKDSRALGARLRS